MQVLDFGVVDQLPVDPAALAVHGPGDPDPVLCAAVLDRRRVQPAAPGAQVPRTGPGAAVHAVDPYGDVRHPLFPVAGRFRADLPGEGQAFGASLLGDLVGELVLHIAGRTPEDPRADVLRVIEAAHHIFFMADGAVLTPQPAGRGHLAVGISPYRHLHIGDVVDVRVVVPLDQVDGQQVDLAVAHLGGAAGPRLLLHADQAGLLKDLQVERGAGSRQVHLLGNLPDDQAFAV